MYDIIKNIVKAALKEDLDEAGDITSAATLPPGLEAAFRIVARHDLVVCGLEAAAEAFSTVDKTLRFTAKAKDGDQVKTGALLAEVSGHAASILTAERTALNLMQRMSGVATLTKRYVEAVAGTGAVVLDTRKTMPGLRMLDKYAVRMGGGQNHRIGLYDGILIKDNHIAASGGVAQAVAAAKKRQSLPVTVECDTLEQAAEALVAGADRLLLDNMNVATLRQAVAVVGGKVKLEASGGITLETIREVAETGVDFIAVGAITHSAPAVDIGLDEVGA